MAAITFMIDGEAPTTVEVRLAAGAPPPTLLAVARDNGVPVLFNCGTGDCGACLVDVEVIEGEAAPMGQAERFYLHATGRLGKPDGKPGARARLACQYKLNDDDKLAVRFTTNVGCL